MIWGPDSSPEDSTAEDSAAELFLPTTLRRIFVLNADSMTELKKCRLYGGCLVRKILVASYL